MDLSKEDHTAFQVRIFPDVLFRDLSGEAVLLDLKSQRYFGLDEVGTRIWQLLNKDGCIETVVAAMCGEYEADEAELRQDLRSFLLDLAEAGLIELEPLEPACS